MSNKCDARAYELLKAALDIFEQQRDGGYWDAIACTAKYDGTDCDAFCLSADITECLRKHDEEHTCQFKYQLADNGWADHVCSNCGYTYNTDVHLSIPNNWNFCPSCGAKVVE